MILSQVTFSRFLKPDAVSRTAEYRSLLNSIAQKSADFVVCLKDFSLVAVVELDDRSHSAAKDDERDRLLAAAGINVIRFTVREMPTVTRIREAIAGKDFPADRTFEV